LKLSQYDSWTRVTEPVLWLQGNPGTGKSTLTKKILRDIESNQTYVTAYHFFNARGQGLEKTYEGFLRSLAHQFASLASTTLEQVMVQFRLRNEIHGEGKWNWEVEDLEGFVTDFQPTQGSGSAAVFVDALDECVESDAGKVVAFISKLAKPVHTRNTKFQIFVSSRYYPGVSIPHSISVQTENHNAADIVAYVESKLPSRNDNDTELQNLIVKKSSSVFLWVVLVVEKVLKYKERGETFYYQKREIENLPPKLQDLFQNILKDLDPEDKRLTCEIMQLVYRTRSTLSPEQLYVAMSFCSSAPSRSFKTWRESGDHIDDVRQIEVLIRSRSRGLLEVKAIGGYVQFIHESVRNFLVDHDGFKLLNPNLGEYIDEKSDYLWTKTCVNYLLMDELTALVPSGWTSKFGRPSLSQEGHPYFNDQFFRVATKDILWYASGAESSNLPEHQLLRLVVPLAEKWNRILFHLFAMDCHGANSINITFLHAAANYGLLNSVRGCSPDSHDFNAEDAYWHTPLWLAAARGHVAVVEHLLTLDTVRADICCLGTPPISVAIKKGHVAIVRMLAGRKDACINTERANSSPLLLAAEKNNTEIVRILLKWEGIKVNVVDEKGRTALNFAARHQNAEMQKLLEDKLAQQNPIQSTVRNLKLSIRGFRKKKA
jgi:Ankyrin repeats (3 copies)/NACHT domain